VTAPDIHLTWIVPCRRACVKKRVLYHVLLDKWRQNLVLHQATLIRWYDLDPTRFSGAEARLSARVAQMNPEQPADVSRSAQPGTGGSALALSPMRVRLWKGPLRVLLEDQAREEGQPPLPSPPDAEEELDVTEIEHGRDQLRLELSRSHKEAVNPNAEFLMGDVVEFPLFKFLVDCGKTQYQGISFNPEGSFLCGTALADNGQPRVIDSEPGIHDNLIAMRLQLLLCLFRGAFYNLVAMYGSSTLAPRAADPDSRQLTVYARGLMYGASWMDPSASLGDGYWQAATSEWGYRFRHNMPANLPTRAGLNAFAGGADPVLTPGIACSPTSLTLSSFMLNLDGWGRDSVSSQLTPGYRFHPLGADWDPQGSIYWGKFEETPIPAAEMLGEGSTSRQQAREQLGQRIAEILRDLGRPAPLEWPCISQDSLSGLDQSTRSQIDRERSQGDPAGVLSAANARLRAIRAAAPTEEREREREAQRTILRTIHRHCHDRFREVRQRLQALLEDEATWSRAELQPPGLEIPDWPADSHPAESECTADHGITDGTVTRIRRRLEDMQEELTGRTACRNMLDVFHDITVFSLPAHELSIVKVYPYDQIMTRDTLPLSGRMAAYDPLSGAEQFPEGLEQEAQLFYLEASGALEQWTRPNGQKVQACGIQPFKWATIEGNTMHVWSEGERLYYSTDAPTRGKELRRAFRIHDNVLISVYPGHEGGRDPSPPDPSFKPFAILALNRGSDGRTTPVRPLGDYPAMSSEWAVPFPTYKFAEVNGRFPRRNQIEPYLNTAHTEVGEHLESVTEERDRTRFQEFRDIIAPAAPRQATEGS